MLLGDRIASAVVDKFDNLKPRGKPQGREWTVLAGIVAQDTREGCCAAATGGTSSPCSCLRVVSLATGNKCVGRDKIPDDGSVVHDSHAEVLARRALLLRLWTELHLLISSTAGRQTNTTTPDQKGSTATSSDRVDGRSMPSPIEAGLDVNSQPLLYGGASPGGSDKKLLLLERGPQDTAGTCTPWRLKPYLRLHMYISDAPCGDASIYEQKRQGHFHGSRGSASGRSRNGGRGHNDNGGDGVPPPTPLTSGGIHSERSGRSGEDRGDAKRPRCAAAGTGFSDAVVSPPLPDPPLDGDRNASAAWLKPLGCTTREHGIGGGGRVAENVKSMGAETMTFTGAKIVAAVKQRGSPDQSFSVGRDEKGGRAPTGELVLRIDREQEQQVGALRIKSSRSNISEEGRTMSMSCSDKLAKWAILGLQGGLLASWVEPIFLTSLVISADPRTNGPAPLASALTRAIPGRAALASSASPALFRGETAVTAGTERVSHPPTAKSQQERMEIFVAEVTFERSKAQSERRVFDEGAARSSASRVGPANPSSPVAAVASTGVAGPSTTNASDTAVPAAQNMPTLHERTVKGNSGNGHKDIAIHNGSSRFRRDRKAKKAVPSGTSLNWIEGLGTGRGAGPGGGDATRVQAEVTLSATGRMQGAVSKGVLTLRTRSRLCRARLLEAAELVARAYHPHQAPMCDRDSGNERTGKGHEDGEAEAGAGASGAGGGKEVPEKEGRSYWRLKQASHAYRVRREAMLSTPTFRAWLVGGEHKQGFAVDKQTGVVPLALPAVLQAPPPGPASPVSIL